MGSRVIIGHWKKGIFIMEISDATGLGKNFVALIINDYENNNLTTTD